jgi:hypothetical protein
MVGSRDDFDLPKRNHWRQSQTANPATRRHIMKASIKFIAPALGAAAIGAAVVLAPIASADTNPLVPYGTDPHTPYVLGYHVSNHDESYTTNGQLDTPF